VTTAPPSWAAIRKPSQKQTSASNQTSEHLIDSDIRGFGDCRPALYLLADDRIELLRRCRFREDAERPTLSANSGDDITLRMSAEIFSIKASGTPFGTARA
jgi:hypothetical protein